MHTSSFCSLKMSSEDDQNNLSVYVPVLMHPQMYQNYTLYLAQQHYYQNNGAMIMYQNEQQMLSDALLHAVKIPEIEKMQERLVNNITIPTLGVFYSYSEIFDFNELINYPEFLAMKECNGELPTSVGHFGFDPLDLIMNQKNFVIPVLKNASQKGLDSARIDENGIFFYLNVRDCPEQMLEFYRLFFLSEIEILHKIAEVIDLILDQEEEQPEDKRDRYRILDYSFEDENKLNHLHFSFGHRFSQSDFNRLKYELRVYYSRKCNLNLRSDLYNLQYYDNVNNNFITEPLVMRIFFNIEEILPKLENIPYTIS